MYSSVLALKSIHVINEIILTNTIISLLSLERQDICDLVKIIFEQTYFCFEDKIFKQVSGLPMGNSLSGIASSIFMSKLEQRALQIIPTNILFKRYVDDICIICKNELEADQIYSIFQSQHQNIKFEIEKPTSHEKN